MSDKMEKTLAALERLDSRLGLLRTELLTEFLAIRLRSRPLDPAAGLGTEIGFGDHGSAQWAVAVSQEEVLFITEMVNRVAKDSHVVEARVTARQRAADRLS